MEEEAENGEKHDEKEMLSSCFLGIGSKYIFELYVCVRVSGKIHYKLTPGV